jgi:hypothetical protein
VHEEWTTTDIDGFGRRVFESLAGDERAIWAADLLDVCLTLRVGLPALEHVVTIGRTPPRWAEGHDAFQAVRQLTLAHARAWRKDHVLGALLDVGETAAKIIYNASGQPAPFDFHAGWRLAPRLRAVVETPEGKGLEAPVWERMMQRSLRREPTSGCS